MENLLLGIDLRNGITLHELRAWMDGGTVELFLTDQKQTAFAIAFCQKMSLKIYPTTGIWIPGSFLLNEVEIPIRSASEHIILDALKAVQFSEKMPRKDRPLEQKIINNCISFVESEDYLETARIVGRL